MAGSGFVAAKQRTCLQLTEACGDGLETKAGAARGWMRLQQRQAQAVLVQVASTGHGAQLDCATLFEERCWTSLAAATIAAAIKPESVAYTHLTLPTKA